MKKKGHIVFCGYTSATEVALKEMQKEIDSRGVIILSEKEVPKIDGVTHLNLD